MTRRTFGWVAGLLLVSTIAAAQSGATSAQDGSLTNSDVIALVKAGLGDDVVIAKIRQSRKKAFDLSTDGLIALKKAGVPQKVIAAMLGGTDGPAPAPAPVQVVAAGVPFGPYGEIRPDSIEMLTSEGSVRIDRKIGRKSSTNVVVGMLLWCNVTEARAEKRTRDTSPSFRIPSQHRPSETYALVRAESNEKDRSVKLESVNPFAFRTKLDFAVDEDWTYAVNEEQVEPGIWQITPKQPLKPGEYGVIAGLEYFYGFGIDGDPQQPEEKASSGLRSKFRRKGTE